MRTTKIIIKNLFGIKEAALDGRSVELSGPKGAGKTSVLDAIRFALTNRSDRDYIIHQGADEGEIIIETDTGLQIDRKARAEKGSIVKVREGSMVQTRPAEFLAQIFTPLQLDPIRFTQLSRQEKNREILNLIEFPWDLNWIREQFGEIPQGVNYSQHILQVLADIQAENGYYFQSRQALNRDIRNKQAFIADIAKDIPPNYDYDKWESYPISERYRELEQRRSDNVKIEEAKAFLVGRQNMLRGLQGERDLKAAAIEREISNEREQLTADIARMEAQIQADREKMAGLNKRLKERIQLIDAELSASMSKLSLDSDAAKSYAELELSDTEALRAEIDTAERMRRHLNEYRRMIEMQGEVQRLSDKSAAYTEKIELARDLPGQILETATIPIKGLTVENGIPLINGLPISNLSDGELLELCVDITVSRPGQLGIVLIDGAERLDDKSRAALYDRCKAKGLQLIATRVSDANELEVTEL